MSLSLRTPSGSPPPAPPSSVAADPIRVMIVDDSVVVRGLIGRWIEEEPKIVCAASYRNGKMAVDDVERIDPDVVVLDVEMPEMDGLTALPLLLAKRPNLVVIMASSLTRRNAEISLKALGLGASDYVPKPDSNSSVTTSPEFRRELMLKIATLGQRARLRAVRTGGAPAPAASGSSFTAAPVAPRPAFTASARAAHPGATPAASHGHGHGASHGHHASSGLITRPYSSAMPRIVAIGSSTGGPQALGRVLGAIGPAIGSVPVVLTQHMPPTFTAILAEHMSKASGRHAAEGVHGERLEAGRVYVAPGGRHMVLARHGADIVIQLTDGPPVNFCKPAVDPLFDSVAQLYGPAALAVVLTGMGSDGANGCKTIAAAGGSVIAQDEDTSVVWGMPGAVAHTGAACEILPLDQIGPKLVRLLAGGRG